MRHTILELQTYGTVSNREQGGGNRKIFFVGEVRNPCEGGARP